MSAMEPSAWLPMQLGMKKRMVRMQEQRKNHHRHHHAVEEARIEPTEHGSSTADLKHDLAEILDEIDSVLEENAEGFVQGYPEGNV